MDDENILDQKIKEIENIKIETKKKDDERNSIKKEVDSKIKEKENLQNQIAGLEEKKKTKLEKLEKIKSIISGDENFIPDFDIKPEEVFKYIPKTPADGLKDIENSLEDLKDLLNIENKKKIVIYIYKNFRLKIILFY